jgi:acylphosphatase
VFAQRTARDLGVRGWARNLEDGRVEVLGIGSLRQLDDLEGELRVGPPAAEVRHVSVEDESNSSVRIEGFHIR